MKCGRRVFLSAGAATLAAPAVCAFKRPDQRPNIIFILADDLGYADLGCYGRTDIATPCIDSIAAHGIRFTDAYSASCVCSPTRLSLITGRYPGREPAGLDEPIARNPDLGLSGPSFVAALRDAGYQTSLVGKWHLGHLPRYSPLLHGYQRFFGIKSGVVDYFTHLDYDGQPDLWEDDKPATHDGYLTEVFGNRAVAEVARLSMRSEPFLLSVHFTAPHWPWEPIDDPDASKSLRNLRHLDGGTIATFRKMVEALDRNVGAILAALERAGNSRKSIVVFTSDNGGERFAKTWPHNGRKGELLEGGIRVPAIISWPDRIPAGRVSEQVMITMDWTATLLSAAGVKPTFSNDGEDMLPILQGATTTDRALFWRHKANDQRAMRLGSRKYLSIGNSEFLFDLGVDPQEVANLKDREPHILNQMREAWSKWNSQMLPYPQNSYSENSKGITADRY